MIDDVNEKFASGSFADLCPALAFIPTPLGRLIKQFSDIFNAYLGKELDEHKDNFDKGLYNFRSEW